MLPKLFLGWCLLAFCVAVHAIGVTGVLRWARRQPVVDHLRFWPSIWLFVQVSAWIVMLHLIEILGWAIAYAWTHAMPDLRTSVYFSAVTYTTTGYGDLVLPNEWRLVGAIEALSGILMCGWSTGFFFAIVSRLSQPGEK
jgi:hypothetical protein